MGTSYNFRCKKNTWTGHFYSFLVYQIIQVWQKTTLSPIFQFTLASPGTPPRDPLPVENPWNAPADDVGNGWKRGMRSASWNFTASTIQNLGITRFFGPTVPRGHFGKWILVLFFYTRFKRGSILASFSSNEMPNILFVTNHHLHCFK